PGGLAAFLVERGASGVTVGEREKNMGIKGLSTHGVKLEDVRVPGSARLGGENADLRPLLDASRIAIGAMAVGVARAAFDHARDYAKERRAFGVAIAQKQAIAFKLANMAIEIDAMRLLACEYDEREHEKPWDFLNMMWQVSSGNPIGGGAERRSKEDRSERNLAMCVSIEELSWGDAGLYLSIPNAGLGGAAVAAAGTPEQKERFLARFSGDTPKWAAMAITEPGCGSDSSAIQTTAVRDGDHWVLNG